jgi:L-threonylcarbamoyladenylate synthase
MQKKKSRRGKIFYSCSTYPKCDYAVWNEPLAEPCPKCNWPVLTLKVTKTKGAQKVCPQKECGYTAPRRKTGPPDIPRSVGASPHGLRTAARAVAAGAVIAYPTEAVYGLGCDPLDAAAVYRLLAIKNRDEAKGLILIAAHFDALAPFVEALDAARMAEIQATWPGPNTWLLPARPETPPWLTGAHDTLAVRVTAHPVAAALCQACARSAQTWHIGQPQARRWRAGLHQRQPRRTEPSRTALGVRLRLAEAPDLIVSGPCGGDRRPSTIRDGRTAKSKYYLRFYAAILIYVNVGGR